MSASTVTPPAAKVAPAGPAGHIARTKVNMGTLAGIYVADRLARRELTAGAARNYRSTLRSFVAVTGARRDPRNVERGHVERWLTIGDHRPSTRRTRFAQVRKFCSWCVREGYMTVNPTDGVDAPRSARTVPRALSVDECRAIVAAAPDARWRTVVLLMLHLGLRAIEIEHAQVGDVDLVRRVMLVRGKGYEGGGSRTLPLPDEAAEAVAEWIDSLPNNGGPLFARWADPSRPISAAYISRWVASIMDEAGVKRGAYDGRSGHALRHTVAHSVLDRTGNLETVRQVLGHASISTTQIYLRGWAAPLEDALEGRRYLDA